MEYRIKEISKARKVSIGALADAIGLQRESLSRIVNGANTSTDTLEKIANSLGVDITELFAEKGDFVAFVRRQGETFTFDSEKTLIDYAEGLKENVSKLEVK